MNKKTLLEEKYPNKKIEVVELYRIDGELLGTKEFIAKEMKVNTRAVGTWVKDGLEPSELSLQRLLLFDLSKVKEWHSIHKQGNKSRLEEVPKIENKNKDIESSISSKIEEANKLLQVDSTTFTDSERILKVMTALSKTIEVGQKSKELIPKKDIEKTLLEMIATLIGSYKNDIKILPKELENLKESQIKTILENNYKGNILNFQKLEKIKVDNSLYEIVSIIQKQILKGISTKDIIKQIEAPINEL